VGVTVRIKRAPAIDPEKCAEGAGSIEIGPTSMRYVPSASKVPSARMIGRGNWPWPHPTARSHPVSITDRQAPSPVHRPVASGPSAGPVGLRVQASRQLHATSAATSTRAGRRLTPRYNAAGRQEQNAAIGRPDVDPTSPAFQREPTADGNVHVPLERSYNPWRH